MLYLDSSALIKLAHGEDETPDLRAWLEARAGDGTISSIVARIEVIRACRRLSRQAEVVARDLLAGLDVIPLDAGVVESAGVLGQQGLRTSDAIHLASAMALRTYIDAFCCYDRRLALAARAEGFVVEAPGQH